jgi:long-chain acyl-CoA synthetase
MLSTARIANLGDALWEATHAFPTQTAFIEANRDRVNGVWTHGEVRAEADRLGGLLQSKGVEANDRVAILMGNQARWPISAMAAFRVGAIVMPLDYKLTPAEQLALLQHGTPKALITEQVIWRRLVEEDPTIADALIPLIPEAPDDADLKGAIRWESESTPVIPASRRREDTACIVYSSGTGGTPKGCMLSHGNYLAQAEILGTLFPLVETDRYFSILPTNHAIDFMCGFILPMLFGATVVHQRTLRPQFIASTMKRQGITHMAVVPLLLKALGDRIREQLDALPDWQRRIADGLISVNDNLTAKRPNQRVSSLLLKPIHEAFGGRLKQLFCGGAFVDPELAQFFYRLGLPVAIGYGLTEAGTVVTVNDLKPFRPDTVGMPVRGTSLEIRDADANGIGEVWIQGPTVMQGYLDAPELTAEAIVDGWLRTGDLGHFDASGHLKLVGRRSNMIVTGGGKNIYPEDVEATFDDLSDCEESCVFATDFIWPRGSMVDETLVLVIRPQDALTKDTRTMVAERNRTLADFKRVSHLLVWSEPFPRTASMKVKRSELAKQIGEQCAPNALEEAA